MKNGQPILMCEINNNEEKGRNKNINKIYGDETPIWFKLNDINNLHCISTFSSFPKIYNF